ncbi:MAG: hypothetical protein WD314_15305 [Trueperaceae bacterium]
MTPERARLIGFALLGLGALALVANTGIFGLLPAFVWVMTLFAAGAAVWMLGAGCFAFPQRLLLFIGIGLLATTTSGRMAGTAATGFIAMAFALVYLRDARQWWAIIPAGVMAGASLVTTVETLFPRWDAGPLFLLVLAGTFTLLYLLPRERGGQGWALAPAVVLIMVTVVANDPSGRTPGWLVPLVLIGSGVAMLWWWRRR